MSSNISFVSIFFDLFIDNENLYIPIGIMQVIQF